MWSGKIVQIADGCYAGIGLGYGRNDRSVTAVAILVTGIVELRAGCHWLRACSEKIVGLNKILFIHRNHKLNK